MELDPIFRMLASLWHGGQWSPLYAFSSTGTVVEGLSSELRSCVKMAESGKVKLAEGELDNLRDFFLWAETEEARKFPEEE